MRKIKSQNGITLVALVITIIILIILAGISISTLTGSGLFARANDAKIETKMSEIEEFATMKIYELYLENVNNMDAVNDATITTALKAELEAEGYKTKDANTTSEKVNGLKIQDSTGQNNFEFISLLQQKETTIKVDLDITSQAKTYVKIYDNWYELIINDKTVKISREKHDEPVDSENKENTYEIKLTPPESGITMTAGKTPITSETAITPGASITIKSGNDIGTFAFNVKETTSSVTRNVDVKVVADPTYATDLSIAVEGGANAEVAHGESLQLVATIIPTTSTDTVNWSVKSGSATIDSTGLVTANSDAEIGSKITVSAICNRKDGTTTTVGEKNIEITVKEYTLGNAEAAMPAGATITVTDASQGIVMVDSKNNEWVWIEVPKTIFKNAKSADQYNNIKTDLIAYTKSYRESGYEDKWYDGCGIVATADKTGTEVYTEMYNKMLSSIYTNGGFWISRYEAGIEGTNTDTASNTILPVRYSHSDITSESPKAVSQAKRIPYNHVYCREAQSLASAMTTDSSKRSSLLFGIQWDLVCKYLEVNGNWDTTTNTASYYINSNSTNWGNYSNSSLTLKANSRYCTSPNSSSGKWSLYNVTSNFVKLTDSVYKTNSYGDYKGLLTTGASEDTKKMNIYDFAGNQQEWTLELCTEYSEEPCTFRGGAYNSGGTSHEGRPASYRNFYSVRTEDGEYGFRATLY